MATVRVWIIILTVWITLYVCPFNCMAHTANRWCPMSFGEGYFPDVVRCAVTKLLLASISVIMSLGHSSVTFIKEYVTL
jgi:hypothetical protein